MSTRKLTGAEPGTPFIHHQPKTFSATDDDASSHECSAPLLADGTAQEATDPIEIGEVSGDLHTEVLEALAEVESELVAARLEINVLKSRNQVLAEKLLALGVSNVEYESLQTHDELTGVVNHALLERRVQQAIVEASTRQTQLALLMIGLDDFGEISDRLGAVGGDHFLMAVAGRIAASVRLEDLSCRYDATRFVVLLSNILSSQSTQPIVEKIRERIGRRYRIGGVDVQPTASIGISFYPANGGHCSALLKRASAARTLDQSIQQQMPAELI